MGHKVGVDQFSDAIPRMIEKAGNVLFVLYALEGFVDEEQLKDMVGANGAKGQGKFLATSISARPELPARKSRV